MDGTQNRLLLVAQKNLNGYVQRCIFIPHQWVQGLEANQNLVKLQVVLIVQEINYLLALMI